jgi:TonB family protein
VSSLRIVPLLIILGLSVRAPMSTQSQASPSAPAYPDSEDGLKNFIEEMMAAVNAGNSAKMSAHLANLPIPDHAVWFVRTFGADEGTRLDARYQIALEQLPDSVNRRLKYAAGWKRTGIHVKVLQKPAHPNLPFWQAIADAMIQPVTFYSAEAASPDQKYPAYLGDFVYVDGAFRSIDFDVFHALSTAPPLRIRQGGNVTAAILVHKVPPTYPEKALAAHLEGSVVLHVIVGTDGTVKQVEPVSGDPTLAEAAVDAVKQWTYKPTLLNGSPVEVDSTVTVDFHL